MDPLSAPPAGGSDDCPDLPFFPFFLLIIALNQRPDPIPHKKTLLEWSERALGGEVEDRMGSGKTTPSFVKEAKQSKLQFQFQIVEGGEE